MSEQEWLDIFGDNLASLTEEWGYSQRELARDTGLSEASISNYIHKRKMPGVKALVNLAYALGLSLNDLMDFGDRIE